MPRCSIRDADIPACWRLLGEQRPVRARPWWPGRARPCRVLP